MNVREMACFIDNGMIVPERNPEWTSSLTLEFSVLTYWGRCKTILAHQCLHGRRVDSKSGDRQRLRDVWTRSLKALWTEAIQS